MRHADLRGGTLAALAVILVTAAAVGAPVPEAAPARATAGDWPQLFGPERSAAVAGTGLFADEGLPDLRPRWRRPLGKGYSSISVLGSRAYTMDSDGTSDYALGLDAATGEELWRRRLDSAYQGHGGSDDGPTSTPTVTAEAVYLVSPKGQLLALDPADGRLLWRHDLPAEYGAVTPTWSFATSPLVEGRLLIVQVGGVGADNLMAFDRETGRVVWSAARETRLDYSSPVVAEIAGVRQVIVAGEERIYAVRPEGGELLWDLPARQSTKLMPVVLPGGRLFVPTWNEGMMVAVQRDEAGRFRARVEWTSPYLKGSYSPTVYHQGHLYGFNGSFVTCLDPATGEPVWRQRASEGSLILVDGHLLIWGQGELRLAEASPGGYRQLARAKVADPRADALLPPTLAGARVYLRPPQQLIAVDLVPPGADDDRISPAAHQPLD